MRKIKSAVSRGQKFDGIKNTRNSVRSYFYDVISYVNIDKEQGYFLTWDPKRFVGIWCEAVRCQCITNKF